MVSLDDMRRITKQQKKERAVVLRATRNMSWEEVGEKVAEEVNRDKPFKPVTVKAWVKDAEVSEEFEQGFEEYKKQLRKEAEFMLLDQQRQAGDELNKAKKLIPTFERDEDGEIKIEVDEDGEPQPVVKDYEVIVGGDEAAKRREEIRDILQDRLKLWGANEGVEVNVEHSADEELIREAAENIDI